MKLPLNRSYLNGRVRPWNMKYRLSDLMHVLRRSVESATQCCRSAYSKERQKRGPAVPGLCQRQQFSYWKLPLPDWPPVGDFRREVELDHTKLTVSKQARS